MKNLIKLTLALTSVATLMSGCTVMKQNEAAADAAVKKTEDYYQQMQIKKPDSYVSFSKEVYLTNQGFKIEKPSFLPDVFKKTVTYTTAENETLASSVAHIAKMLTMSVRISDDAVKAMNVSQGEAGILKSYQGSFEKVLTTITSKAGVFWSYENNSIKIFSAETKIYALDAPIGSYNLSNNITAVANSSNSGSQSTTNGTSQISMDYATKAGSPWDSAVTTIKSMLSSTGHLDTNPVEGYVTITDNPERQRSIAQYINKINDKTNKKIAIRIDVYDVQTDAGSQHGFDINAVAKALGGKVGWLSAAQASVGASGAANQLVFKDGSRQSVFNALNTIGKTTQTTGTTVYTISGQPAPIQNAIQQNYLRSMSTTTDNNNGKTVSMDPGTVTTGYSMMVTPRIESNNEILINLNLQLSTLLKMDRLNSDPSGTNNDSNNNNGTNQSQFIQLPMVHTKSFAENMILRSGQTILIAGFQNDAVGIDQNSIGDPAFWALGGSKATQRTKSTTVVVVTPYVI